MSNLALVLTGAIIIVVGLIGRYLYKRPARSAEPVPSDIETVKSRYPGIIETLDKGSFNNVVKLCLRNVVDPSTLDKKNGQHFYIAFDKNFPGIAMPPHLLSSREDQIVIVLHHAFKITLIEETRFSVELYFKNKKEMLSIPFNAILIFADPSINWAISRTSHTQW